jgi:hypothetical protein
MVVDDAPETLAKGLSAEVHEQPQGLLGQSQISEKLPPVDRRKPVRRFDLDDQLSLDEKISTKPLP